MKKIAPDYYDDLPSYTSWCKVLWDFVFDPAIGPFARVRREIELDGTIKKHEPTENGFSTSHSMLNANGNGIAK